MRANLDLTGGLLLAERVTAALAPTLGRQAADELVQSAIAETQASGRTFAEVLETRPELEPGRVAAELLDPRFARRW